VLTTNKAVHPAGPRWSVTGPAGTVSYDLTGSHLALLDPDGQVIDSLCRRYADRARRLAQTGDDAAMYALLESHYWRDLAQSGDR
jgi:hypothetical protein